MVFKQALYLLPFRIDAVSQGLLVRCSCDTRRGRMHDFRECTLRVGSVSQHDAAHATSILLTQRTQEEDFIRRPAVRLYMPDPLKSILVDDWEKVTKDQKLAPVPSPTPVTKFLNEYESSEMAHRRPNSADADILEETVAGVKEYFNKSLGRILLYRFERQQFYEMHKAVEAGHGDHAGKTLADVYGCEHLLRLFGE